MGVYTESYAYDAVGNLLTHGAIRSVRPATGRGATPTPRPRCIVAAETGNRLSATSLPGDPAGGPFTATYAHDAHGNMTRMPHLPAMVWDEDDRLRSTSRQVVNAGTPATSLLRLRLRRRTRAQGSDGQAAAGQTPSGSPSGSISAGIEIYREYAADGTTVALERETLHDRSPASRPIASVETRTAGQRHRHRRSRFAISSATISTRRRWSSTIRADIISYEEYFPYRRHLLSGGDQPDRSAPKRYRFTGKERDERE